MSAASFHFISVIVDLKVDKHRFKKVSTLKKALYKVTIYTCYSTSTA